MSLVLLEKSYESDMAKINYYFESIMCNYMLNSDEKYVTENVLNSMVQETVKIINKIFTTLKGFLFAIYERMFKMLSSDKMFKLLERAQKMIATDKKFASEKVNVRNIQEINKSLDNVHKNVTKLKDTVSSDRNKFNAAYDSTVNSIEKTKKIMNTGIVITVGALVATVGAIIGSNIYSSHSHKSNKAQCAQHVDNMNDEFNRMSQHVAQTSSADQQANVVKAAELSAKYEKMKAESEMMQIGNLNAINDVIRNFKSDVSSD